MDIKRMATAQPIPAATTVPAVTAEGVREATPVTAVAEQALVPRPQLPEDEEGSTFTPEVLRLPVELDVAVPVRGFRVRNLLALSQEQLIESQWTNGTDLPLAAGDVQLAWTEFEVVENKLAVRVTRVA
jgi:flagellar motor switch/type III secretory pathway protein FliN